MTSILWDAKDLNMAMPATDKTTPITSDKSATQPKKKRVKAKLAPLTLNPATLAQLARSRAQDGAAARKALDEQGVNLRAESVEATQSSTQASTAPKVTEHSKPNNTVVVDEHAVNQHTKLHPLLAHEIPTELGQRYAIKDHVYYSKNPDVGIVFEDKGPSISARSSDADDVRAMIALAKTKNWLKIKVSGAEEFKREAWLAASMQGIEVTGYKPSQQDIALLENAKGKIQNKIEIIDHKVAMDNPPISTNVIGHTQIKSTDNVVKEEGVLLLTHGKAKYLYDDKNDNSYYVRFLDKGAEKTVWGVDLERAITEANANIGDRLSIARDGKRTVMVNTPVHDKTGKIIGTEQKEAQRNAWHIQANTYTPKAAEVAIIATAKAKGASPNTIKAMQQSLAITFGKLEAMGVEIPKPHVYDAKIPAPASNNGADMTIDKPSLQKTYSQPQVSPRR